jgi:hypothetical protein
MVEIAAAAARLAGGDKPLVVPLEPEPEQIPPTEPGMIRLFLDAGRRIGVRPTDIVGAIANEAGVPGHVIGAIDIYDDFALVDVPIQYKEQVLEGMPGATIRSRETSIRLATVHDVALRQARRRVGIGTNRRASSSPLRKKSDTRKGKKAGPSRAKRF